MSERIEKPVEGHEPGEARSSEQQDLENATLDPGALIEQSGEFRQAESTQEAFTRVVEESKDPARQQTEMPGSPIKRVSRGEGDIPACDGSSKNEALPLDGDVRVEHRFQWEAGSGEVVGATPTNQPELQAQDVLETTRSIETLRETGRTLRALSAQPVAEELSASNKQKMQASNQGLVDIADRIDQLAEQWEGTCTSTELKHETMTGLSDLTSERQLQLQQLMEKKTQIEQTLSNVLKTFENTQQDLVANLK
jgi:hypothetical protein